MGSMIIDLEPVSHMTIDTLGRPGQRVFYLQGGHDGQLVTLIIEKEPIDALVTCLDEIFNEKSGKS